MCKEIRLFLLAMLCLVFSDVIAQQAKAPEKSGGYKIIGHIRGLKEGEKVVMAMLSPYLTTPGYVRADSAYVKNGEFIISGKVPEGACTMFAMSWDQHPTQSTALFVSNNECIHMHYEKENIENIPHGYLYHYIIVEGSSSTHGYECIAPALEYYRSISSEFILGLRSVKNSVGFDPGMVDSVLAIKQAIIRGLYRSILENPEEDIIPVLPWFCSRLINECYHPSFMPDVYAKMPDSLKNSGAGQVLKGYLPLCVGQLFPDFTLPALNGTSLHLKDIVAKSKLTLVHFWSWNSYEIDSYQEELKRMYTKYHDKGLSIIGVSSDSSAKNWKIAASDLPWYNVSDLKGVNGVVETVYHEYGNPATFRNTTNVLIDAQGKIVAWDVSGIEQQWYLWKALEENAGKAPSTGAGASNK